MSRFDVQLSAYVQRMEDYLQGCFLEKEPQKRLFEAMRYSLLAGGKRIRPVLTLAFCELCGGTVEDGVDFAAAVEMIQTYSLIHDDLPAMDDDDFRRGKPSNHKVYGEAMAILAGDALLTAAFGTLTKANLPAERIVEAVRVLSLCAGELGMVGGQVLDMAAEERECTAQEVTEIELRKTAALISAACRLGVIAAGGAQVQQEAAARYAEGIGLAFQIHDDVLDVIGDAATLGKAVGTDGNKNTFVRLYGVERCQTMVREKTEEAVSALSAFENADFLSDLANMLATRKH